MFSLKHSEVPKSILERFVITSGIIPTTKLFQLGTNSQFQQLLEGPMSAYLSDYTGTRTVVLIDDSLVSPRYGRVRRSLSGQLELEPTSGTSFDTGPRSGRIVVISQSEKVVSSVTFCTDNHRGFRPDIRNQNDFQIFVGTLGRSRDESIIGTL